ncbi:MAG TPA: hypothetical protein VJX30_09765 [Terriglobales bacterium]|nr:hypothetical protein [Terriglobales bacterium]
MKFTMKLFYRSGMENGYYNYFTQIEDHYLRRHSGIKLLSTMDWAQIETWKSKGVPLQTVLRVMDDLSNNAGPKRINSLAYFAQAVATAAELEWTNR